jgi:hypothetical protein
MAIIVKPFQGIFKVSKYFNSGGMPVLMIYYVDSSGKIEGIETCKKTFLKERG